MFGYTESEFGVHSVHRVLSSTTTMPATHHTGCLVAVLCSASLCYIVHHCALSCYLLSHCVTVYHCVTKCIIVLHSVSLSYSV